MYVGGVRWPSVSDLDRNDEKHTTKPKTDLPKISGVVSVGGIGVLVVVPDVGGVGVFIVVPVGGVGVFIVDVPVELTVEVDVPDVVDELGVVFGDVYVE